MKIKFILIAAIVVLSGCVSLNEKLYKEKPAFYSYIIGDVNSDNIEKENAAEVYASIASCQKITTALVALKDLGEDYKFTTELFKVDENTKENDFVISFAGDPTLTSKALKALLEPLKNSKMKNLILDVSAFQTPAYSQNIMANDVGLSNSPPVSAANIDGNLLAIKILPSGKITNDMDYETESGAAIDSKSSTMRIIWEEGKIKTLGTINKKELPLSMQIAPNDIYPFVTKKIKKILDELNIKLKTPAQIKIIKNKKDVPSNLILVRQINSLDLKEIIKPALKKSDNLVFDSIYLTLIHKNGSNISEWNEGDLIIKKLVRQYFAIDLVGSVIVDGSGLSRYNRTQPKMLFAILKKGFTVPEFVDALPKSGEEKSTLEKRIDLPNYIRAKTGNILGNSCLAGYAMFEKHPKAFVIVASSFASPAKDVFKVVDKFVKEEVR